MHLDHLQLEKKTVSPFTGCLNPGPPFFSNLFDFGMWFPWPCNNLSSSHVWQLAVGKWIKHVKKMMNIAHLVPWFTIFWFALSLGLPTAAATQESNPVWLAVPLHLDATEATEVDVSMASSGVLSVHQAVQWRSSCMYNYRGKKKALREVKIIWKM